MNLHLFLFYRNILSEISLRLQKQQLTEIDSNLIESICGIVGNLCYLPKHTVRVKLYYPLDSSSSE